ncbi:putative protease inhibitor [Escherichia coli]|uniref:Putative protease inhibitor n=1 Tax=Escherichia coli TaxID=562 RepID=A0A377A665_ECOLX|nr:putative protease inhibitor [Escherichia coli]
MRNAVHRSISAFPVLLQMQRDNGGFALWDKNGDEEYWLTAYVMDFLVRAGEQGYRRADRRH